MYQEDSQNGWIKFTVLENRVRTVFAGDRSVIKALNGIKYAITKQGSLKLIFEMAELVSELMEAAYHPWVPAFIVVEAFEEYLRDFPDRLLSDFIYTDNEFKLGKLYADAHSKLEHYNAWKNWKEYWGINE